MKPMFVRLYRYLPGARSGAVVRFLSLRRLFPTYVQAFLDACP